MFAPSDKGHQVVKSGGTCHTGLWHGLNCADLCGVESQIGEHVVWAVSCQQASQFAGSLLQVVGSEVSELLAIQYGVERLAAHCVKPLDWGRHVWRACRLGNMSPVRGCRVGMLSQAGTLSPLPASWQAGDKAAVVAGAGELTSSVCSSPPAALGQMPSPSAIVLVATIPATSLSLAAIQSSARAMAGVQVLESALSQVVRLSTTFSPLPVKLVTKIEMGQFVEMKELLADNIALQRQLDAIQGQLAYPLPAAGVPTASSSLPPHERHRLSTGLSLLFLGVCSSPDDRSRDPQPADLWPADCPGGRNMTRCFASRRHLTGPCHGTSSAPACSLLQS